MSSMVTLVSSFEEGLNEVQLTGQQHTHKFANNKKQDKPAEVVKAGTALVTELHTESW